MTNHTKKVSVEWLKDNYNWFDNETATHVVGTDSRSSRSVPRDLVPGWSWRRSKQQQTTKRSKIIPIIP